MNWHNNGNVLKSAGELNALVNDVILDPGFKPSDLAGFTTARAEKAADKEAEAAFPWVKDFEAADVEIQVPSGSKDVPPRIFKVPGLRYRSLVSVIKAAFMDPLAARFHLSPFKLFHRLPKTNEDVSVLSHLYLANLAQNAFITRLGPDFDLHRMLVVDFMHEGPLEMLGATSVAVLSAQTAWC
ncbi:hypothetical protein HMN09_01389300 [Mycena chlorophos]|uniref:Uncharacterized protein n=1 Tax=Mycena chlorophos TaxID=658473 RepID=A0A8H6RX06_MYCCL|nr:hypothetical protein HMN09_01389300 [Mycena chlorophos]